MAESLFMVHVHGNRPHYISKWTQPYKSIGTAKGLATKWTTNHRGEPKGDWIADIYRLEPDPTWAPDAWPFRLVQVFA